MRNKIPVMNLDLFKEILQIESTSGTELSLAEFLESRFCEVNPMCQCVRYEVGDGTLNLLFRWRTAGSDAVADQSTPLPKVLLCSHLDTVPPYIPPQFLDIPAGTVLPDGKVAATDDVLIKGRGSCDAKGQFFSMWSACEELSHRISELGSGFHSFGLLLLAGEETGSYGAKVFDRDCPGSQWIIVGEPTDNKMVTASKGTKSFVVRIHGKACHSGYPELGHSAVDSFVEFVEKLKSVKFPEDPVTGATTWNIGKLISDNPQNVLSPLLTFRLYFRTTAASDAAVCGTMDAMRSEDIEIENLGGDTPLEYCTFPGFGTTTVAFGSDTPRLTKFRNRSLCGPGSIFVAHTSDEYVLESDLEKAGNQYSDMVRNILSK